MAMIIGSRICCLLRLLVGVFLAVQVSAGKPIPQLKLHNKILQESVVQRINEDAHAGWKASMNPRLANYTVSQFMHLLGVKPTPEGYLKSVPVVTHKKGLKLPTTFDARTAWPQCSTIADILDQGHCGSCWAFGAVESLSDRFCIQFGMNITLSVNDLLSCCGFLCGEGCDGGYPISAWRYLVHSGVVTSEVCFLWETVSHSLQNSLILFEQIPTKCQGHRTQRGAAPAPKAWSKASLFCDAFMP